jgi:hypothetical protein
MRILVLVCALLSACGGDGNPRRTVTDGGDRRAGGGEPMACDACRADQVCANGVCTDLPSKCPCPLESYCDLSSNTCKPGCTEDAQCSTGRICNTTARTCKDGCRGDGMCALGKICTAESCVAGCRQDGDCKSAEICEGDQCVAGCRLDSDCGAGKICDAQQCRAGCRMDLDCGASGVLCDPMSLTCRTGCHQNSDCPLDSVCDIPKLTCKAGCDGDARCNAGKICEAQACVIGCRTSASCPLRQYCDGTSKKCVAGCNQDLSRCGDGEACVSYTNGTTKCTNECYGNTCAGTDWECFMPISNSTITTQDKQESRCRKHCSSNAQCAAGEICSWFSDSRTAPSNYAVRLCTKPCNVGTDYCPAAAQNTINPPGPCYCATDGTCKHMTAGIVCYPARGYAGL